MIKHDDDNFEDDYFELGDDIDDPWDDESIDEIDNIIDEENAQNDKNSVNTSARSKINIIKPIVIAIVMGSGVYLLIPIALPPNTQNQIPIIKLDEAQGIYSDDLKSSEITDIVDIVDIDEIITIHPNQLESRDNFSEVKENGYDSILMPLPENIAEYSPPLAELTNIFQEDDKTQELTQLENKQKNLLSEDDLLSKTEAIFEATLDDESIKDFSNLSIENTKENLPIETLSLDADKQVLISDSSNDMVKETHILKPKTKPEQELKKIKRSKPLKDILPAVKAVKKVKNQAKENIVIIKKNPIWIIRAAGSGSAIIYDKTSGEMKSVEINDTVSGVGRIKSIKLIDGIWVITGTSSKIEQ